MGSGGVGTSCSRTAEKHVHTCGMVWKQVQTGGNKSKRVETTIRMGTGKVGKSCSRTPRKTTKTLSDSPENPTLFRSVMENDGRSKSVIRDGKWRSRYPVFTDGRKTRVSATKTPRNPNRTGWENGELRDPRNPQNSWEGGFPFGILGEVGSAPPA